LTETYTRAEIERALDAGRLKARMSNGNLWSVRRNGATKTWKREPGRYRIPVKFGFKGYGTIDETNSNGDVFAITGE
jgi:hypothetical protein